MTKALLLSTLLFFSGSLLTFAQSDQDTQRLAEIDQYWNKLSKTVSEGDFEGYGSLYHEDAVVVFATRQNKVSVSIADALAGWKEGFAKTKSGERQDNVEFRFSQRIGNHNTAHEIGIFHFTSVDNDGNQLSDGYVHFEMLWVKRDGKWLALMESQISSATKEEWESLK